MPRVHFANSSPTRLSVDMKEPVYKELHTPVDHEMLRIEPPDFITFQRGDTNESGFSITSISKIPITYKIQTTSPEKFRVRPRCGLLNPGESVNIGILLKTEHMLSESSKDKFLVMGTPSGSADCTASEMADLWKHKPTNSPDVEQHRLVCQYKGEGESRTPAPTPGPPTASVSESGQGSGTCATRKQSPADASAQEKTKSLEDQLKLTQNLQFMTLGLLLLLAAGFGYLLYQMNHLSSSAGAGAGGPSSSAQKSTFTCGKQK